MLNVHMYHIPLVVTKEKLYLFYIFFFMNNNSNIINTWYPVQYIITIYVLVIISNNKEILIFEFKFFAVLMVCK